MIPGKNGDQASRPREHLSSLPARRVDCGARSFAKDTEGGRVERAWLGRAAAEGPVALGRARHRGSFEDPKRRHVDKRIYFNSGNKDARYTTPKRTEEEFLFIGCR